MWKTIPIICRPPPHINYSNFLCCLATLSFKQINLELAFCAHIKLWFCEEKHENPMRLIILAGNWFALNWIPRYNIGECGTFNSCFCPFKITRVMWKRIFQLKRPIQIRQKGSANNCRRLPFLPLSQPPSRKNWTRLHRNRCLRRPLGLSSRGAIP